MRRYVAYIRVSTARQGERGSSLDEQRAAIERYAERYKLTICEWIEERETAAKQGRSGFAGMVAMLQARRADGVIIHKVDRSARNLRDWATLGDLIDRGLDVHFANESLDLSSRGGRLSADIQAVVAADFIRNLREEVRKGFYGRLRQGLSPRPAPLGYRNEGRGKPKSIDPVVGPIVRRAFELYATGRYTLDTLVVEVRNRGLRSGSGGFVGRNMLSRLLNNEFYTGVLHVQKTGERFDGRHQPLVPRSMFDRVQTILQNKTRNSGWKHHFSYRGELSCKTCSRLLIAERQKGHHYYRCHSASCRKTSLREEEIDRQIDERLRALSYTNSELLLLETHLRDRSIRGKADQATAIQGMRLRLSQGEDREKRLVDAYIDHAIDKEAFETRKHLLRLERSQLMEKLETLDSGEVGIEQVIREKLELIRTLSLNGISANPVERLEYAKKLSSNLSVQGKYVVVEWDSPFRLLENRVSDSCGSPERDTTRTMNAHDFAESFIQSCIADVMRGHTWGVIRGRSRRSAGQPPPHTSA